MERYRRSRKIIEDGFRRTREKEGRNDAELVVFRYEVACANTVLEDMMQIGMHEKNFCIFVFYSNIHVYKRTAGDNVSRKQTYHKMKRDKIQKCSMKFLQPCSRISTY